MAAKLTRQRLLFGVLLLLVIAIGEIVLEHFELPAWPAFLVMIFFFMTHMDSKAAPSILVGSLFGIVCFMLAKPVILALAPTMGVFPAKLAYVLAVVYAIVALGEIIPLLFNNYAFTFLLVSGVAAKTPKPNPYAWMGVEIVGGAAFVVAILGIKRILMAMAEKPAASGSAPPSISPAH